MKSLDDSCGPFEYRWCADPAGYKQLEVYRDAPSAVWEEAQQEIERFMKVARNSSLALCVYLFPLDDSTWHRIAPEAIRVLRAITS